VRIPCSILLEDVTRPGSFQRAFSFAVLGGLSAVALSLAGFAGPERAGAKGEVFFDPSSPAGKEYALPVPRARSEASGGGESRAADSNPPLFGVGVGTGGGDAGGAGGSKAGASSKLDSGSVQAGDLVSGDGGFINGTAVALAAAVLVLGAGVGIAVRRMQRPAA
jgi:hypothetical protein